MINTEESLKQFGLTKNEIKIVVFLMSNLEKEFTASEISKQTKISLSRIYPILNRLSVKGLIEKKVADIIQYSITDPKVRFSKFFAVKRSELNTMEKQFYDSISSVTKKNILIPLKSREELFRAMYNVVKDASEFDVLSKQLSVLAHDDEMDSWEKEVVKIARKRLLNGTKSRYLFDKSVEPDKLDKLKQKDKKNILKAMSSPNFEFRTIRSSHTNSLVISDKEVVIGLRDPYTKKSNRGLLSRSPDLIEFMKDIYNDLFREAKEVMF